MLALILICIALIILSIVAGKPYGWISLAFSIIALLAVVHEWPGLVK